MTATSTRLFPATSADDYAHFGRLIELYETWLRQRGGGACEMKRV